MAEKRKDPNGRILRTGESQCPNGTYMYRYTTPNGKKKWCYAPKLKELRELEKEIAAAEIDGIDTDASCKTVLDLNNHTAIRKQTEHRFKYIRGRISKESFGRREFANVRQSDAKAFFVYLHETGFPTERYLISSLYSSLRLRWRYRIITCVPIRSRLSSVIKNDAKEKFSLTQEQIDFLLDFVKADKVRAKHYDKIVLAYL